MSSHAPDAQVRHRFFRAMVLMGGSLAVGCGGTATMGEGSGGSGGGGNGGGGSGGPGGSGAGGSSGGAGGSGGPGGSGGGIVIDAGVGAGGSVVVDGGPIPCVPAQWDCSGTHYDCAYDGAGYELPQGCACDGTRPRTAADCGADESFTCLKATYAGGQRLSNVVPFDCSCVATQESCTMTCDAAFYGYDYPSCDVRSGDGRPSTVLCGCAVVVLR